MLHHLNTSGPHYGPHGGDKHGDVLTFDREITCNTVVNLISNGCDKHVEAAAMENIWLATIPTPCW